MDAANVDLKAFTDEFYCQALRRAPAAGARHAASTCVHETERLVRDHHAADPGQERLATRSSTAECKWIASELGPDVPLHFTAFHPDCKMTDIAAHAGRDAHARARDRACVDGLHYVYTGNVHDEAGGTTYCPACEKRGDRARLVSTSAAIDLTDDGRLQVLRRAARRPLPEVRQALRPAPHPGPPRASRRLSGAATRATALGAVAVLLWSALALLTVGAKRLPPFQLLALTFAIAGAMGFALAAVARPLAMGRGAALARQRRCSPTAALAGYHLCYFVALRNAPAVDASLIAYLWPLLIVLFAGIAHGGLRPAHLAGAALGLLGTWLVVSTRGALALDAGARRWLCRRRGLRAHLVGLFGRQPALRRRAGGHRHAGLPGDGADSAAPRTCLFERTVAPAPLEWLAVALLGLGPVGAAFFLWDYGTKHGNLPLLGVFSYAAPVLSTLLLVAAGGAEPSWQLAAAALLVAGGAALASWPRK